MCFWCIMESINVWEDSILPRKTEKLQLRKGDFEYLRSPIKQRTIQAQMVIRAHILLERASGISIRQIASIYHLRLTLSGFASTNILVVELIVLSLMNKEKDARLKLLMMQNPGC